MEDGINWILYAAMIVIAFISWVFNKIQEATAARQRGKEVQQHREERERRGLFDDEEELEFADTEPATPPPLPTSGDDSMRRLVEALGGNVIKAPTPPPPEVAQTAAAPQPSSQVATPRLSAAERAALERVKQRRDQPRPKRRAHGSLASMSIADLVRDPDGIRKAVILREILDLPRAERPWE